MQEEQRVQPRVLSMLRPPVPVPCSPLSATGARAAASDAASPLPYNCTHCRQSPHHLITAPPCVRAAANKRAFLRSFSAFTSRLAGMTRSDAMQPCRHAMQPRKEPPACALAYTIAY